MTTNSFSSIISKWGSDKSLSGYADIYEPIFANFISRDVCYLEIGLGTLDASIPSSFIGNLNHYPDYQPAGILKALKEFFIDGNIYGIDVAKDCMINEPGITTFQLDSTSSSDCNEIIPKDLFFDIVLDDGLHTGPAQLKTFFNFFDKVKDGGIYIIEDIGGCADGSNIMADSFEELKPYLSIHQYYYGGNFLIIHKNNSNKGLTSLQEIYSNFHTDSNDITIVSGLWDINRIGRDWSRYQEHFDKFLKIDQNMCLWIPKELESFVLERRSKSNTFINLYELKDIQNKMFSAFWDQWQSIRSNSNWQNQAAWLSSSPQCKNEYYNPIVMSKMFFLHESVIQNSFQNEYFIWLDAGITQTVYENYFYNRSNFNKLKKYLNKFLFLAYPYEAENEIHGFDFNAINKYANCIVDLVCRGGLFGGRAESVRHANSQYYHLLMQTLNEGFAGTEESIFSILYKLHPELYEAFLLDSNGLIVKFMESIENNSVYLQ